LGALVLQRFVNRGASCPIAAQVFLFSGERSPKFAGLMRAVGRPARGQSMVGKGMLAASLALALTVSAAQAQMMGAGHKQRQDSSAKSDTQKPKADEKAYAAALSSLPDKPHDPWHGVR
jgi:hypothetical protein